MYCFKTALLLAALSLLVPMRSTFGRDEAGLGASELRTSVMLILRGIADDEHPKGLLDDQDALEYARRNGFHGEVVDAAADYGPNSTQISLALERIRRDGSVTAIYGFSGGGYNARAIWQQLNASERDRIRNIVVVGSPGVEESQFAGRPNLVIVPDPPEGHMAGPRSLLDSKQQLRKSPSDGR